jgi:hypothetical protein
MYLGGLLEYFFHYCPVKSRNNYFLSVNYYIPTEKSFAKKQPSIQEKIIPLPTKIEKREKLRKMDTPLIFRALCSGCPSLS